MPTRRLIRPPATQQSHGALQLVGAGRGPVQDRAAPLDEDRPARAASGSSSGPKLPELRWVPRGQPGSADDRLPRVGAAAHHVRSDHCLLEPADARAARPGREHGRVRRGPRGDPDLAESRTRQSPQVPAALHVGAQDREHAGSGRARASAATAAAAPVRTAVMEARSTTASGVPSSAPNKAGRPWWDGRCSCPEGGDQLGGKRHPRQVDRPGAEQPGLGPGREPG